ncbi:hypothetical protein Pmani_018689 [Petrolisthes manimaculis]|uniref:Uncharacterized protein n=1 Tax=Petrolisthes manimaculis TaxID=1843537 RepID=A0AAE1PJV2_9EUCA|nr:hypothetical protein Pmani_018689 [Petrolisthes manimaculis]
MPNAHTERKNASRSIPRYTLSQLSPSFTVTLQGCVRDARQGQSMAGVFQFATLAAEDVLPAKLDQTGSPYLYIKVPGPLVLSLYTHSSHQEQQQQQQQQG